jgi:hypothetical protein
MNIQGDWSRRRKRLIIWNGEGVDRKEFELSNMSDLAEFKGRAGDLFGFITSKLRWL